MTNKILLIDDDVDYLYQIKSDLTKAGFEVTTAEGRKEAQKTIQGGFIPDIIIVDLMMEEDDSGFQLCREIKNKYPDLPIIMATGVASETGIRFGLDDALSHHWIKADAFLNKGVRGEQLIREIRKFLK